MRLKLIKPKQQLIVVAKFSLRRAVELKDLDTGKLVYAQLSSGVDYERFSVGQLITLSARIGG
jgi:hypothetical protein